MAKKITTLKKPPLIFNFHVDEFHLIETPKEIAEWEHYMKDIVRLEGFDKIKLNGGGSLSVCNQHFDDCDLVQV